MRRFCTVPIGDKIDIDGERHYVLCGEPAVGKKGAWYICKGHEKYYPIDERLSESLEGGLDEEDES